MAKLPLVVRVGWCFDQRGGMFHLTERDGAVASIARRVYTAVEAVKFLAKGVTITIKIGRD